MRDGIREVVEFPLEDYPLLVEFPTFAKPRFLSGEPGKGIGISGISSILFGTTPSEVATKLGVNHLMIENNSDPESFARMIAKIGYCMAVATKSIDLLGGPSVVLPGILNDPADLGRWVGTTDGPIKKYSGLLHRVAIYKGSNGASVRRGSIICGF